MDRQTNDMTGSASTGSDIELESVWKNYFPFTEVYDDQEDGINKFLHSLSNNRYLLLQGACGTGKTVLSLTAALTALEHSSLLGDLNTVGHSPRSTTPNTFTNNRLVN